jgi:hypothetical protein
MTESTGPNTFASTNAHVAAHTSETLSRREAVSEPENGTMTKLYMVVGLAMFIATLVSAVAMAGPSP